ncbi:MAG TPA: 50S ribosomal protein L13 [Nitrolancea sp.]|jgi:large subunit ribosomal protein L13|nr:50S ribosomal protein L13 [Nitrolancea sp.]
MKTYSPKASEIQRDWYIVDAQDQTLGRISTRIASVLKGKHKPVYATHMDMGDFVIVVNAEKIRVSGNKETQKLYYRHSQFPGGFRSTPLRDQLKKHPTRPLEHAVRNMLPKNALGDAMFKKLKVYAGPDHPHTAQKPQPLRIEG